MASELSPSNAPELPTELAFLSLFSSSDSEDDDDLEALFPAPTQLSSREERIQRAIDSGKKAYGADQAFTPFGVSILHPRRCRDLDAETYTVVRGQKDRVETSAGAQGLATYKRSVARKACL